MKHQERLYPSLDSEGNYSYQPMTRRPRRSVGEFLMDWFRLAFWLFVVCAALVTAYYISPFPSLSLFGLVLHP